MKVIHVYILTNYSWEGIKEKIESKSDYNYLERNIAIYDFGTSTPDESFAILSTHQDIDKLLQEFPVKKTDTDDKVRVPIKQNNYELLFGSSDLKDLL